MRRNRSIVTRRASRGLRRLVVLTAMAGLGPAGVAGAAESPGESPAALRRLEAQGVRELIVRRDPGLDAVGRRAVRAAVDGALSETLLPGVDVLRVPAGTLDEAAAVLRAHPDVRWVEANSRVHADAADPTYLWAHANDGRVVGGTLGLADADADVTPAWAQSTGAGVTVAVVDSGVDADHPDLASRLATNAGETGDGRETNGLDDDHNGLVDDWRGWDFVGHDADPDDEHGHGTHVAGTIAAARDNGFGVAGVAPDATVLALRALDASGGGWDSDVAAAMAYAGAAGVPIVNASLGGGGDSPAQEAVIRAYPETLFVVAAGNDGQSLEGQAYAPCTVPAPNVICVGASDARDQVAGFSNRGASHVDLFAPGARIVSTAPGGSHNSMSGTSMAAPHVAGVAALVLAAHPALGARAASEALLAGVDPVPTFGGVSVTGGRLSATGALAAAGTPPAPVPAPTPAPGPSQAPTPAAAAPGARGSRPNAPPATIPSAVPTPDPMLVDASAVVRGRWLTVRIELRAAARVRLILRGPSGRAMRARRGDPVRATVALTRRLPARVSRIRLGSRLASGVHRLSVTAGGRVITRRVVAR